jgi:hypothetical protein
VVLCLVFVLALSSSVVGLVRTSNVNTTVEAVGCSVSVVFDDVLNGNYD